MSIWLSDSDALSARGALAGQLVDGPTVTYDREANAAYIRFSPEPVEESEEVSAGIVLDYDADGRIVGMEVMDARAHLSPELLDKAA